MRDTAVIPNEARQFSWLERQPVTLEVRGSSPLRVATFRRWESGLSKEGQMPLQLSWQSRGLKIPVSLVRFRPEAPKRQSNKSLPEYADLAHLVERRLAKAKVAGSSPVIRSIKEQHPIGCCFFMECTLQVQGLERAKRVKGELFVLQSK